MKLIHGLVVVVFVVTTNFPLINLNQIQIIQVVYTFDFKSIMGQQCDDNSDYDTWLAHEEIKLKDDDEEKGCQLGQKIYYRKLKKESVCYQGTFVLTLRVKIHTFTII